MACIGMAENRFSKQRCNNLVINIEGDSGAHFLNQTDIRMLATENGGDALAGSRLNEVRLSDVEARIKSNKLIKKCQVYRDLKGNLVINVEQERPLARWIHSSPNGQWRNASGRYINEEGAFFPLSDSYSARTLLVTGPYFLSRKNLKSEKDKGLLDLIRFLDEDPFWKAQVAQVEVGNDGEISLLTLLGDQRIEFGTSEGFEKKFKKIRLFYERVLSQDWGRFSKISVKFQDQIVCE
ncbi:cell division protein FtsQ/DivIB [Dyadobacter helix]|nr:cell division protein FtsQ/DivIB [Dyadobacter sp. CECT 9275]